MAGLTIGKFAEAGGVGVETVRFYQRRGLLARPARGRSGFAEYTDDDRWRLAFIRRARRLGFTLGGQAAGRGPVQVRDAARDGRLPLAGSVPSPDGSAAEAAGSPGAR